MRYLYAFVSVLALGMITLTYCGDPEGAGGRRASGGTGGAGGAPECRDSSECDDDNECTEDACATYGACIDTPVANETPCDFGGLPGLCVSGVCMDAMLCEGVGCDDGDECTDDVCDPANGACINAAAADNTVCDFDGLPGLCMSGACMDARLCDGVDCDDGIECTEDICNPADGACINRAVADDTACDFNGLPGRCVSAVCIDAMLCEGVVCDGNPCTFDERPCDPLTGECPAPTMFAQAGTICDRATVDDGVCDGSGTCIEPQGDLEPVGVSFDPANHLEIIIKNRSGLVLPENIGNVRVFVDGETVADIGLGTLVDDSYRQAQAEQIITLDVRIAGQNRRVGVGVDTSNEILETNEDHNHYTRTVTPPKIVGPDLVVSDLRVEGPSNALLVEVRNDGTALSPATDVHLEIKVNGTVVANVTEALPVLGPGGGSVLLRPTPEIPIGTESKVRVALSTIDSIGEVDNTNQSRTDFFPPDAFLAGYESLLLHPKISSNLRWQNALGVHALTAQEMSDLLDAIRGLEVARPVSAPLPPVESAAGLSETTAWYIFVAHAAHSLWVEKNDLVEWKLVDMADDEVATMLDGRQWFVYLPSEDRYAAQYGWITPWSPTASYELLINFGMIKSNHLDTIYGLTEWARSRLSHNSGQDLFEQYGYDGLPPLDRMLYALEGRTHITSGCGGTSGLYVAMLRAINIPAAIARIVLGEGSHCRPDFPSVDRSMPHGDDPYNAMLVNSSRTMAVSETFYTGAEMESLFLAPVPDCNSGVCNTVGEQALHNAVREKIQRSFDRRGDYLLQEYQRYGPEHLRNVVLHGIQMGDETVTYAYPLFSELEKDAMISAIEDHLTMLGGEDIEAGESIVSSRFTEWGRAKNSLSSAETTSTWGPRADEKRLWPPDCPQTLAP